MVQNDIPQTENMKYDKNAEDGKVQNNIFFVVSERKLDNESTGIESRK